MIYYSNIQLPFINTRKKRTVNTSTHRSIILAPFSLFLGLTFIIFLQPEQLPKAFVWFHGLLRTFSHLCYLKMYFPRLPLNGEEF